LASVSCATVMSAFCERSRILIEPPLCIADDEIDFALGVLREVLRGDASP